jgi:hypothetical protein
MFPLQNAIPWGDSFLVNYHYPLFTMVNYPLFIGEIHGEIPMFDLWIDPYPLPKKLNTQKPWCFFLLVGRFRESSTLGGGLGGLDYS